MAYGSEDMEGSQTICIEQGRESTPVLTLRATKDKPKPQQEKDKGNNVRWKQDVVDNEHMNKKKTKICCIFHPQEEDDEGAEHDHEHYPSDSSDSDSSSSSDSDNDEGLNKSERRQRRIERRKEKLNNGEYKTNAYEFQPKYPNRSIKGQ